MKLRELGEFQLIERIRQRAAGGAGVCRGIGDDAAELTLPAGDHLLTSTDMLIEGVHFRRDWTSCTDLGHKAVAVNLSDIAAMGGQPRHLYIGLACPDETELDDLDAFLRGALDLAEQYDVTLVGGDTCRSPGPWVIAVTIEGSAPAGEAIGRDGARPGDLIMVSGTLGDSALALTRLQQGVTPDPALLVRHHRPQPRIELGRQLATQQIAHAMIDLSDGLAGDLQHILDASGCAGVIDADALPRSEPFRRQAEQDPTLGELALYGGEDYELLFTVAPEKADQAIAIGAALQLPISQVGIIQAGAGELALREHDGALHSLSPRGYDHFSRS